MVKRKNTHRKRSNNVFAPFMKNEDTTLFITKIEKSDGTARVNI